MDKDLEKKLREPTERAKLTLMTVEKIEKKLDECLRIVREAVKSRVDQSARIDLLVERVEKLEHDAAAAQSAGGER